MLIFQTKENNKERNNLHFNRLFKSDSYKIYFQIKPSIENSHNSIIFPLIFPEFLVYI